MLVTVSTVGYGDTVPIHFSGKLLVMLFIILGFVVILPQVEELYHAVQVSVETPFSLTTLVHLSKLRYTPFSSWIIHTYIHYVNVVLYMYANMYVYMYVNMYVSVYVNVYVYMYVNMYVYMYVNMYVYMYVNVYVNVYVNMYSRRQKKFPFTVRTTGTGNPIPFPFNFRPIAVQSPFVFNPFYRQPVRSIKQVNGPGSARN